MDVEIVPCLKDNYAYLLRVPGRREALVVDPSEAPPVEAALSAHGLELAGILCTHHHYDHVGGNEGLLARFPGIPVVGSVRDRGRIPGQTKLVEHDEEFELGGLSFRCLLVPGHTLGAVSYYGDGAVFTGDTLFAAGCGRLFEGTPEMMQRSLNVTLGGLPGETRVYAGHEYTAKNLSFAELVEPSNAAVRKKAERVRELRAKGVPSLPSTLAEERETNPFLRLDAPDILARYLEALGRGAPASAVLGALRKEKDAF